MNNTKKVAVTIRANLGTDNEPCFTYIDVGTFKEDAHADMMAKAWEATQNCNHILTWEILKDGEECGMNFCSATPQRGLRLDVTVTGDTWFEVQNSLNRVSRYVEDEYITGSEWCEESSLKFNVHGEEFVADIQHDDESFFVIADDKVRFLSFDEEELDYATSTFDEAVQKGFIGIDKFQGELRLLKSVELDEDSEEHFITIDQEGNLAHQGKGKFVMERLKADPRPFWIYQEMKK